MTKRLITGTANEGGRRIFVQPADGSMKLVSYGRIRLEKSDSKICFSNDGQETGLVCLRGTCVVSVNGDSFTMKRNDALYVPKGMLMSVYTEQTVDLLECSAPVDGLYPPQFVAAENVEGDEKLHFVVGIDGARREISILLGSNIQAGRLIIGITRYLPGNWTSWPPHEHAAMLEEIYVYMSICHHQHSDCNLFIQMRSAQHRLRLFAKVTRYCCLLAIIPMSRCRGHA